MKNKLREYTSEITQKFLHEANDSYSIAELQAMEWNTLQGKIKYLKDYININDDQAKKEIKKWLISLNKK